ncbi:DUF7019 family protein [Actinoplanes sp. G11-F43]|uniref:DUF7019 family protein n=1 Tax=Actinoplanes sp. G11-F43 TaxID=3424130 RepID=UPI003D334A86
MSFRYFIYISDAKVEMLLQQIDPGAMRTRSTEVGVDLKVFSGKRGAEKTVGADRVARLERVVRFLTDFGDLGDVENPGQFFAGTLPLSWGPMVGLDGHPMVYFGGRSDKTVLGLGGSRAHMFTAPADPGSDAPLSRSLLPSLLRGITAPQPGDDEATVLAAVHEATTTLPGPAQRIEFVAKRLVHGTGPGGETVLLGSPLYLAMAD